MQKSKALNHVIAKTKLLQEAAGRPRPTANHFMISLFDLLVKIDSVDFPDELSTEESLSELLSAAKLFPKDLELDEAALQLSEAMCGDGYRAAADEFAYAKVQYGAELAAPRYKREQVDVYVFTRMLLESPTDELKAILGGGAQTSAENGSASTPAESVEAEKGTEPEKHADGSEGMAPEKEPSGLEMLGSAVRRTREIQNRLLERIFGQDQAIKTFVSGYFQSELMAYSGKLSKKPKATFLFAGPPGVGKTFLAEQAAEALGLPFRRFDMSEYSDKEANLEFCGSDKVYKNGKPGNVTDFVANNPKCVLLFDEIEKAHINIIYLFLQLLDAGRLRDNYTDEEVSFSDAVVILTTNAGKGLYEDPDIPNLSSLPRKRILKALASDTDPVTKNPLFPSAICSRFASGNVVMFNHLGANDLLTIARKEIEGSAASITASTGICVEVDPKVPAVVMLSEGGKADARTVKGRANAFFHEELYELFRLLAPNDGAVERLKTVRISPALEQCPDDICGLFVTKESPEVLVFSDPDRLKTCKKHLRRVVCHGASTIEEAKEILFNHDISIILCDVLTGFDGNARELLNVEDVDSVGSDFLSYVLTRYALPVYLLQQNEGEVSEEEFLSFAGRGVRDLLTVMDRDDDFESCVLERCEIACRQSNMLRLARENKVLSYKTAQTVSEDGKTAEIRILGFRLGIAVDTEDSKSVLDSVAKPNLRFSDVIGAEDAKEELKYFVQYLKDPAKFLRKGVRAPKGVLLYGPPGTGKTLLAKAMAGESDVTFLLAEGNQFLKRYVGEGAEAVHALFTAARKYAPSIIFIDEIDAIGKDRNSEGSDTTSNVLTALLTEMDGFNTDTTKPVFVLAATNYSVEPGKGKSLDAALLRRFDRRIYVDLPNKDERKRFLEMKIKKNPSIRLSPEQIDNIAMRSTGMSLAELESVVELALRTAIRSDSGIVGDEAFEEAFETFNGGERREWSKDSLERTARHEAGHTLLSWISGNKPSYVTVVARGDHGGYMQFANDEGKGSYKKSELLSRIRAALAGRAAEIVYYGDEDGITTSASGDLRTATRLAENMLCYYGMDGSVGLSYLPNANGGELRARVNGMLQEALDYAIEVIRANKKAIDALVDALLDKNHLKGNEIDAILKKNV